LVISIRTGFVMEKACEEVIGIMREFEGETVKGMVIYI
jgi:hypothetical protein